MYDVYATANTVMDGIIHQWQRSFHLNASSKACASWRSGVLRPSVNQL